MRFGATRLIRGLRYASAKRELEQQLETAEARSGRKHVWVTTDTGRLIDEANTAIMLDQIGRGAGGKYEGAVKADRIETTRTGQAWEATDKMWNYVVQWLDSRPA